MTKQQVLFQIRDTTVCGTIRDAEKILDAYVDSVVLAFHLWDSQRVWQTSPPLTVIKSYQKFKKKNKK